MNKIPVEEKVRGIVNYYAWGGTNSYGASSPRGSYGPYQPAANGGLIQLLIGNNQSMFLFGGPGQNQYQSVTIDQFFERASTLLKSYCKGSEVEIEYRQLPDQSFPTIFSVVAV
jgi:hypothetical protein